MPLHPVFFLCLHEQEQLQSSLMREQAHVCQTLEETELTTRQKKPHMPNSDACYSILRMLRRIPVVVYEVSKDGTDVSAIEGAICLSEFDEGDEKVRVHSRCYHGFHVQCIDVWLTTHNLILEEALHATHDLAA